MSNGRTFLPIAMVIVGAIGAAIGFAVVKPSLHIQSDDPNLQTMADAASRFNKLLPMMVDSETRADSMEPRAPNTMVYHYTLVKRTKAELHSYWTSIAKIVRRQIVNNYKTTDAMKELRQAGVTLAYEYYDKNGVYIAEIEVKASDLD
jgi:hypothetical protein